MSLSNAMRFTLSAIAALLLAGSLSAAEPFFFIQLADPQFGMFAENKEFSQETANLEFAVAAINRLRPAFVIVSGDLVNKPGDTAQMEEYKRIMSRVDSRIPVYAMPGNHDIGNVPSPETISSYTNHFGPDHYTFRHGDFAGIVINSTIIHTSKLTTNEVAAQELWLQGELKRARESHARHIVIFAHHPWFLKSADEPDEYFNIPGEKRTRYLAWFREAGVKHLFSGHSHHNVLGRDAGFESIVTGPVGKPLGPGKSGLRIVLARDGELQHRFYHFGELPNRLDPKDALQESE